MIQKTEFADDVFLFNPDNRAFISGKSSHLASTVTLNHVLRFAFILTIFIVVPLTIAFYFVFTRLLRDDAFTFTLVVVVEMFGGVLYIVTLGYRKGRRMEREGQVILGQVVKYDTRLAADSQGYKSRTRLHYQFQPPQNQQIMGSKIVSMNPSHLKDGRKLPEPGTLLAIMYLDDKWHSPL